MTGLQKTVEIIKNIMNSICDFLVLTMESGDDFPGGRLPTLDLNIWVGEDNITRYIFFEKPMASSMVIQRRSAMPENMRVSTLTQEVIRRMMNTSERLDQEERNDVIDTYARKLVNSGYSLEQSRKFIISGLTGYERRLALSMDKENPKWRPLHEGAGYNAKARRIKKMTAKTSWFKRSRDKEEEEGGSPSKRRKREPNQTDRKVRRGGSG